MKLYDQAMTMHNTVSNQSTDLSTIKLRMDAVEKEVIRLNNS